MVFHHPFPRYLLEGSSQDLQTANDHVVDGWTNLFEKYARQIGFIFPKFRRENKKYGRNHQPDQLFFESACLWTLKKHEKR